MKKDKTLQFWNSPKMFNFLMEILVLLAVFVVPTIFDRRLGIVFSGTKVAFMGTLGSIILGVWAIKIIIFREHRFMRTPLDWPVLSFLLCTTIASLTSIHVYTSLVGFYGRYEGFTSWYLFGLFFFVVTNYIWSYNQIKRIIVTVASVSTIMSIYSIIQRHMLDPYMWGGVVTKDRVIGTIGQPNFLAAYILMAFFMVLALLLTEKRDSKATAKWYDQLITLGYFMIGQVIFLIMIYNLDAQDVILWYFGFSAITVSAILFSYNYQKLYPLLLNLVLGLVLVLNYICIFYTQSRGGYLGLFVGAVVFALVIGRYHLLANWKKILMVFGLIVFYTVFTLTVISPEYSPFARFANEISTTQIAKGAEGGGGTESRLELGGAAGSRGETWKSALGIISDNPIFGVGPEVLKMIFPRYETDLFRFKEAFHVKQDRCHNETFDVSVTKGMIAFFIYLWLLFIVYKTGWEKRKILDADGQLLIGGLLGAATGYLIQNQFSFGVVAITSLFWITWGMVMVIGRAEEEAAVKTFKWEDLPWFSISAVVLVVAGMIYCAFFSFRGDVWFKSGKTYLEMRRLDESIRDLETSLRLFPFEGTAVSHLGIAYLNYSQVSPDKIKSADRAMAILQYGTQIDPFNADNFYMLSKIFLMRAEMGDAKALEEAYKYSNIALKIDPYYAEVYIDLGQIAEKQGKLLEAAKDYEKAFMINPNLVEPMRKMEDIFRRLGKPEESMRVFERAYAKYSTNFTVLETLGRFYMERGKMEKAMRIAEHMVQVDPRSNTGKIMQSEVYLATKQAFAARSILEDIVMHDPRNVPAHFTLAKVYLEMGERGRAKQEFEQVLVLDPNNQAAKEMAGKL